MAFPVDGFWMYFRFSFFFFKFFIANTVTDGTQTKPSKTAAPEEDPIQSTVMHNVIGLIGIYLVQLSDDYTAKRARCTYYNA